MSTGAIVDLMSNDSQRLNNITGYIHILWSGPFQIAVALGMLLFLLGIFPTLAGLLYMLFLIPVNSFFLKKLKKIRSEMMKYTDERVKWTNEVIQAIKAVKQYCYEIKFVQKINEIRRDELGKLKIVQLLKAVNSWIAFTSPVMVSVCSLSVYVLLGHELTAEVIFPAISLFNLLRFPLSVFPNMVTSTAEVWVSIKRIQKFLLCEEMKPLQLLDTLPQSPAGKDSCIYIKGDFSWNSSDLPKLDTDDFTPTGSKGLEKEEEELFTLTSDEDDDKVKPQYITPERCTLKDINILIERGDKVGVIGSVGAGKSSLISTLIGELYTAPTSEIGIKGSLSLVPQQAWIMNETVKNNILFGKPYDEEKYNRIIRACALEPDLLQLPAGDNTEIGEKGINLSGGQKQRISIARAIYQDTDIYLLDDPLSAVDAHVAKHIFENVILNLLANKTVFLVTHYLHLLTHLDYIIFMKEGRVAEQGKYAQLLKNQSNFAKLINEFTTTKTLEGEEEEALENMTESTEKVKDVAVEKKAEKSELMEKEERETGAVKFRMYYEYAKAGNIILSTVIVITCILSQLTKMGSDWWISYWTDNGDEKNQYYYYGIYIAWCASNAIVVIVSNILVAYASIRASKKMHNDLLNTVIRAPLRFFETTPLGLYFYFIDFLFYSNHPWLVLFLISFPSPYLLIPLNVFFIFFTACTVSIKNLEFIN